MKHEIFTLDSTDDSDKVYQGYSSSGSFEKVCVQLFFREQVINIAGDDNS